MWGLRFVPVPVELLLCYLLLHSADATLHAKLTNVSKHLPSSSQSPSSGSLSCQTLLPKSLPGFSHLAPLPKFLVGLALRSALDKVGCQAEAQAVQRQLYHWGGVNATQILIHHLQQLQEGRTTERRVSVEALASALQLLAQEQAGPERARRSLPSENCENEREQGVYSIVRLLPGVGTYYNLGTALYYAAHNCSDKAHERGQDGAIDLGYDLLMAMAGLSGGPMGLAISAALKPTLKAGVQRLIQYYYSEKEVNTPPPETGTESLGGFLDVSDLEQTTPTDALGSEMLNSAPYGQWEVLNSYDSYPEAGNLVI